MRVFVPGNHDFILGWEKLSELLTKGNFQLLVSNAEFAPEVDLNPVKKIKVSCRYGLIEFRGLMTPETKKDKRGNAAFSRVVDTKDLELDNFSGVIISHLGLHDDRLLKTESHIIGGHSHHEFWSIEDSGRFLVNCGGHARVYSSVLMAEAEKTVTLNLFYTDEHKPAPEITNLIRKYEAGLEEKIQLPKGKLSEKVFEVSILSKLPSGLDAMEKSYDLMESHLRISDSCITRLTADAISEKCGGIALIPAAAFRSNFFPGQQVTVRELMEMYYWDNKLIKVKTTGAELIKALARGVLSQPKNWHGRGRLLHPSAQLEYAYNLEAKPCDIISSVKFLGDYIDPDETFEIVSTDWIINKCKLFPQAEVVEKFNYRIPFVVAEYAKGKALSESFSERVCCSQSLQWQEKLANDNPRGEYHENPDININLEPHYECIKPAEAMKVREF